MIGAGAAGIMAARRAAELGSAVLLLEKTPRLGTKILISGGGKCYITHDGPIEDVLRAFRPREARFIRPACYRFTNKQIVSLLTERGLQVYTRPDGRIFPVDQTAKDVVAILRRCLDEVGVRIRFDAPVSAIRRDEKGICGVDFAGGCQASRRVVLAVGGSSYPNSGTTGDGFGWATSLGHTVVPIRAALAPIRLADEMWRQYSGVALRDCLLKARQNQREIARWRGDTLFTHLGLSGPCTLEISREVSEALERGAVELETDLLPDQSFEAATFSILDYGKQYPARTIKRYLGEAIVPERLIDEILKSSRVPDETIFSKLQRGGRSRLIENLKGWKLGNVAEVILDKGEVVAGGVSLDEVDPKTMCSLKCPGLYLCGEVLDIAGPVGGYNLQAAFATGYIAGETAHNDQAVRV